MKKLRCLIVEDEALIAFQLKTNLTRSGYDVCGVATRGEQAVEAARVENPEVILMDIRLLGVMDGIEAAQHIKVFCPAHIIFTTGYSDPRLKERAMALSPVAYLVKPVSVSQITAALESVYRVD